MRPTEPATLAVEHVGHTYADVGSADPVVALEDITLRVEPQEFVAICGPSGCGKTTLLEVLTGLRRPTEGRIVIGGKELTGPRPEIGIVFQEESAFPWRTVLENVEFGLQMRGMAKSRRRARAEEMTALVGLHGFEHAYPHQLSGGMRQRVAIARTLATEPEVVVMDEPFGALDEQTRLLLGIELLRVVEQTGASVVFVTHSIQEAALLADRVVILTPRPGRVKTEVVSTLPKPRTAAALASSTFGEITKEIWASLEKPALGTIQRQPQGQPQPGTPRAVSA